MAFSFSLMGSPSLYTDVSTQTHSHQNTMGLASGFSPKSQSMQFSMAPETIF